MQSVRSRAGWLLAACATLAVGACNNTPTVTSPAPEGGHPSGSSRHLMSLETDAKLDEVAAAEAQLPERISEAEAKTLLKRLPADAIKETNEATFGLQSWGRYGFRSGSWGYHRGWTGGFAPLWRGSWSNYLYYPVGSYYFPYTYSAGNYWRYRSAYSPFFYYGDGFYNPYYRSRWW